MWWPENEVGFIASWAVMLVWIGVVTYLIDMVGQVYGWWKDE